MRYFIALLLFVVAPGPAWADMTATYLDPEDNSTMVIEVSDNGDSRLEVSGEVWRLQSLNGEAYIVYNLPAGIVVTRIEDLETIMTERGIEAEDYPSLQSANLVQQGEVTISGIEGMAFHLETSDGISPRPLLVISRDSELAALGRPLARQLDFSFATIRIAGGTPPPLARFIRHTLDDGAPLLFAGKALQGISRAPISPERFRLPATPMTVDQLRQGAVRP